MTPELIDRFASLVGPGQALSAPGDIEPFIVEHRDLYRGVTPLVLRPGTVAEVSAILRLAHETGTAIVPQGGNTGLVGGQIPHAGEIVLSLSRLNAIRAVDPEGDTITVEAGCILDQVHRAAEAVDRLFPLSLGAEGSCQIGGNLSTNAGGTAVLAYGNARDLVLGLEVVLADGRVWNGLRALRKDNTGYSLKDLFIGAEGTLGVITAAVLKLFPRPRAQATALAGVADPAAALGLFRIARAKAGGQLTACELIPRIGIDFVLRHSAGSRDPLAEPHPWYVLIELSSPLEDADLDALMQAILEHALEAGIVADAAVAASIDQARDFWGLRLKMSEVQRAEGGSIKNDVSVPVARVPDLIARGIAAAEAIVPGIRPVPFGHLGDGNIHFNFSQPPGADRAGFLAQWGPVTDAIDAIVLDLGGSISAEHGIGHLKRHLMERIKPPVELELMRTLKAALDPKGILNPGKVV
ncbi:4-phosphoerythronate dehydrogenase (FAD-dependent) [Tepidamorphus gemmatus]|uniref:4-phosphoerythronate dehydrogenase (FAD-dependent) n=1 Tax=Tepidamorphus gemmatus TaxID=747076 RepID=A0A4R3M2E3_9HYPH|nr:FAD-binding oxidoreductase [Tepidamorphus gemmatus]TCT07172.1 4-phosphoerythronate dehydrogenase (FAD-dependent) [Tepidamorphus gemmatus]